LVKNENRENNGDDVRYNCQGRGHIARHCRKPRKRIGKPGLINDRNGGSRYSGKRALTIGKWQPTDGPVYTIGCVKQANLAFVKLKVKISEEDTLLFLIDTGVDISLLKGNKVIGSTEYDLEGRVKVKGVDGSPMETHGVLEAKIELHDSSIAHSFQLVNKQVDILCDGILGRDFLQHARAKICYESQTITLNGEKCKMVNEVERLEKWEPSKLMVGNITLPPRTESIVKVPVTTGITVGRVDK